MNSWKEADWTVVEQQVMLRINTNLQVQDRPFRD